MQTCFRTRSGFTSADRGAGSKYCVTRQWPLPSDQVEAFDALCTWPAAMQVMCVRASHHIRVQPYVKEGYGRLSDSVCFNSWILPLYLRKCLSPGYTWCWIPCQKSSSSVLSIEPMVSTKFWCDLATYYSQLSGMLWKWLVMLQGLKNAPVTFNWMVSQVQRPLRDFSSSYFDDIFVHRSR